MIDDQSPEPLYRQVAGILRERIASGDITSRLPSLKTITQEYGVSHVTAEKAVALLREEGLVIVVIGRGAFVARDRGLLSAGKSPARRYPAHDVTRALRAGQQSAADPLEIHESSGMGGMPTPISPNTGNGSCDHRDGVHTL